MRKPGPGPGEFNNNEKIGQETNKRAESNRTS